jgi:hypothetical protein
MPEVVGKQWHAACVSAQPVHCGSLREYPIMKMEERAVKILHNSFSVQPGPTRRERGRLFDTLNNLSIMRGAINYRFRIEKMQDHNESERKTPG